MDPDANNLFLGASASAWAAIAALGSFATAVIALVFIATQFRLAGARPKVKVDYVAVTTDGVSRLGVGSRMPKGPTWPENALECIGVQIENRGRTAISVRRPQLELMRPWWHLRRWAPGFVHTVLMDAFPVEGATCDEKTRVEAFDSVDFVLDLTPLFGPNPSGWRRWTRVRVRVPLAGQRDKIARRASFRANPSMPQRSGLPVTLRQVVTNTLLADVLRRRNANEPSDAGPTREIDAAPMIEDLILTSLENGGRITPQEIGRHLNKNWGTRHGVTFILAERLRLHGYLDDGAEL